MSKEKNFGENFKGVPEGALTLAVSAEAAEQVFQQIPGFTGNELPSSPDVNHVLGGAAHTAAAVAGPLAVLGVTRIRRESYV